MTRAAIAADVEIEVEEATAAARREARRMAVWCHNTRQPAASWLQLDQIQRDELGRVAEEAAAKEEKKAKEIKARRRPARRR
jgi:hypothetical protein